MAVSGSRRALRREPSSDGIEEEEPSQAAPVDEVQDIADSHDEDEIEAPRPTRPSKAKKEKKKKSKADGDDEQAGGIGLDLEAKLAEMKNHPVDKGQAKRIGGFSDDWQKLRVTIHGNSYALLRDVASTVAEFAEGERGSESVNLILTSYSSPLIVS